MRRILDASFKLTGGEDKGLIDLPGQHLPLARLDLRIAVHNALSMTFLQHPKMRPSEKTPRLVPLRNADQEELGEVSYKVLTGYAHQRAQGTGLLDAKPPKGAPPDSFPAVATIPQSVVPGATQGAQALEASPREAILLLYLMVGSGVFLLRSRAWGDKTQACVVIPEVRDLRLFVSGMASLASVAAQPIAGKRPHASEDYVGRVVGGVEEAALRFLLDINAEQANVEAAHAVAMGKVAWDQNQLNRSMHVRLRRDYAEFEVYRAAQEQLGRGRVLKGKDGKVFVVTRSPVPELIAANLGAEMHWCRGFRGLIQEQRDFANILYTSRELNKVGQAIQDQHDQAVIAAFHNAWRYKQKEFGDRQRDEGANFSRLVEVERERMRNAILRAKTADALAGWFLRFCSDATKGGTLPALRDHAAELRAFLFNPRNTERLQNLLLFALVSYASKEKKADGEDVDPTEATASETTDVTDGQKENE